MRRNRLTSHVIGRRLRWPALMGCMTSCFGGCYNCCERCGRDCCVCLRDCCGCPGYIPRRRLEEVSDYGDYPEQRQTPLNLNTLFYSNHLKSNPNGDFIDNIHNFWYGEYMKLEAHHGYIQWLFPLPQRGSNPMAQSLQQEEIQWFKAHAEAQQRLIKSYQMMLDFYGIVLRSEDSGELIRAHNWQQRFHNLEKNSHNDRRITRIISSMCLLGYEHLMTSFVQFLANEIYREHTLMRCRASCEQFWVPALPPEQRHVTFQYIHSLRQDGNL
jgi:hypothetical protein